MAKTKAHITIVVDRSGSMATTRTEAEKGLKKYLQDQAEVKDVKLTVSLYQFDTDYERVYGPIKIDKVPDYELVPRGFTALYDAIGKGIENTKADAAEAEKVVLVVITDGMENASKEHTYESMTQLINQQQADGWQLVFLAGNPRASAMGRTVGLNTVDYDPNKPGQTRAVYEASSVATRSYVGGQSASVQMPDSVDDEEIK